MKLRIVVIKEWSNFLDRYIKRYAVQRRVAFVFWITVDTADRYTQAANICRNMIRRRPEKIVKVIGGYPPDR